LPARHQPASSTERRRSVDHRRSADPPDGPTAGAGALSLRAADPGPPAAPPHRSPPDTQGRPDPRRPTEKENTDREQGPLDRAPDPRPGDAQPGQRQGRDAIQHRDQRVHRPGQGEGRVPQHRDLGPPRPDLRRVPRQGSAGRRGGTASDADLGRRSRSRPV